MILYIVVSIFFITFCNLPLSQSVSTNISTPTPIHNTPDFSLYTLSVPLIPNVLTLYWKPYTSIDTEISLALVGGGTGYVAVGWSPNGEMVQMGSSGSDMVVGWVSGDTFTVNAYLFTDREAPKSVHPSMNVTNIYGSEINGETTIFFTRKFLAGVVPIKSNGNNIVIGSIQINNEDSLVYHGPVNAHTGVSSVILINFMTGSAVLVDRPFELKDAHALCMLVAWGFVLPLGMLNARYMKHLPNNQWFKFHRVTQYFGFFVALIGAIIAFIMVDAHYNTVWHAQLGTTLLVMLLLQVIIAVVRPHKDSLDISKIRIVFEYFHWWNGRLLVVLGVVQVFSGILEIGYKTWILILYAVLVGMFLIIIVVREGIQCVKPVNTIVPCFKIYPWGKESGDYSEYEEQQAKL